ncbi:MAG: GlsB/YeaQ/YmgE family stress response membrane protein [Rhodothermales bacterium]|nr:GlsB/YeaQ/YmgE family stress response membrane protein [Rhodothermales bacterium]
MSILWIILVGFAAGALAKWVTPADEGGGFVLTTLLGIGGAVVGKFVGGLFGFYTDSLLGDLTFATLGALLILFIYNRVKNKS